MIGRALVIGESLIDVVRRPDGSSEGHPGGSPMNVAIGLGRLGREVHLATHIGQDADGEAIVEHIAASHVELVPGSRSAHHTPTAQAVLAADGSATYEFDLEWRLDGVVFPRADVVHTGSIGAVLEPGQAAVAATLAGARATSTITYDPNIRPDLMGTPTETRPKVEALVALADVVKASDEDLDWLYPGVRPIDVAHEWCAKGPGIVVVTAGGEGQIGVATACGEFSSPAEKAQVVDTVGAGDSYMAGIIDGLWGAGLTGAANRERLRAIARDELLGILARAAKIAAITVSRAGANPPWAHELT